MAFLALSFLRADHSKPMYIQDCSANDRDLIQLLSVCTDITFLDRQGIFHKLMQRQLIMRTHKESARSAFRMGPEMQIKQRQLKLLKHKNQTQSYKRYIWLALLSPSKLAGSLPGNSHDYSDLRPGHALAVFLLGFAQFLDLRSARRGFRLALCLVCVGCFDSVHGVSIALKIFSARD